VTSRLPAPAAILAIVALLTPLYLQGLGSADIVGDDEAREAGIIQDIAERGRWLLPRFNDSVFPDKPPLYHWLAAVACMQRGVCDERQFSLPSALSALALVAVVGLVGARLFDTATGATAALLLGLTPSIFERARVARPDVLLTLILTAALLTFYAWWQTGGRSRPRAVGLGTLLGFAVLAKGPVAPVLAGVTIVAFLACRRDLARARTLVRADVLLPFSVIGGAWYVIALAGWGTAFAEEHFLGRYLGNLVGGPLAIGVQPSDALVHHVSFYPLHLLFGTLPWAPLLVAAAISIWRDPAQRADPRLQFLQVWIAAVVVVFGVAALKLRHYALPAVPAAALLAAPFIANLLRSSARRTVPVSRDAPLALSDLRRVSLRSVGIGLTLVTAASVWWWIGGEAMLSGSDRELAAAVKGIVRDHRVATILSTAGAVLLVSAAIGAATARCWRVAMGCGAGTIVLWMLVIQPSVESALAARISLKPLGEAVAREVPPDTPVYFFGRPLRPVIVYARRSIPSLQRNVKSLGKRPTYVIASEANVRRFRRRGLEPQIVTERVGRTANLATGRVLLVAVPERTEPSRARPFSRGGSSSLDATLIRGR
jgi:4-amino-4-deoxy-L-arabinose transferase-like glycosyltransferase